MSQSGNVEFSRWRAFFWPVHRHELKKLIPMLLIFFFVSFDYNVLRTLKDTLVVTAKSSGAEVIPFIKVWVMFPCSVLLTFLFTRLSNRLNRENVFYAMISFFLLFFFIFIFFIYPARDYLHPHAVADKLELILPPGFKGMIAMFRYWTFTAFYVMSELWSNIILSMLFWGFANQITRIGEAKRFYGLFGIGANFSGIAAGQLSVLCCSMGYMPNFPLGQDAWEQSLIMLVSLVLVAGVAALAVFRWMNTQVLTDPLYYTAQDDKKDEVTGTMSMRENFSYLFKSRYLTCIAFIVVAYNLVINLVEVLWKHQVRELYPNPSDYSLYMNEVMTIIGVISTLVALFISGNSIRKFGWTFTALLTPVILLVTSIGFFGFFFMKASVTDFALPFLGATPLAIVVFFGTAQNCLSRAAKYSVFDATREMAFVPLTPECKIKGKAAIDGVCSRLGKSGGSVIHQSLLLAFASLTASAPYVGALLVVIISAWIYAVSSLGKKFQLITSQDPSSISLADADRNLDQEEELRLHEQKA